MNHLKELRKKLGISKWKLARETGLNWKTIHRIEMGQHVPFERSKEKIAQAIGVTVEEIFPARDVSHIFLVEPRITEAAPVREESSEIVGYLLDKNLRRCAGVDINLTDGQRRLLKVTSEEDGRFKFTKVPKGEYVLISKQTSQNLEL